MHLLFMQNLLIFAGSMAVLGSATKIILAWIERRKGAPDPRATAALEDIAQRLARLEQAMDATAVEVERIAEGQRFTTKLLAERSRTPAET